MKHVARLEDLWTAIAKNKDHGTNFTVRVPKAINMSRDEIHVRRNLEACEGLRTVMRASGSRSGGARNGPAAA